MIVADILNWIKKLFNIKNVLKSQAEQEKETAAVVAYENITEFNLTRLIAKKLANAVTSDSIISVEGENKRAEFLNNTLQVVVKQLNIAVTRCFGIGGIVLKPYVYNGQIYTDIIKQTRLFEIERKGYRLTRVVFDADTIIKNNVVYKRLEYHILNDNELYEIINKAVRDGKEIPLENVDEWRDIPPYISIGNVKSMLFSFIKCPTDNLEDSNSIYGVPVTYGQGKLIKMILDILNEIPDEYKNKKAFVGADYKLFDDSDRLVKSGVYKVFKTTAVEDKTPLWELFSPDIRHTAYFEGIDKLFGLLEKAIGVNRGILTDLDTADATATAIKRSTLDTFNLVDSMRVNISTAFEQLLYAYDVLANAFNLAPSGEYTIKYNWGYSLLEDSAETLKQYREGFADGVIHDWEYRQQITDENDGEALENLPEQVLVDVPVGE